MLKEPSADVQSLRVGIYCSLLNVAVRAAMFEATIPMKYPPKGDVIITLYYPDIYDECMRSRSVTYWQHGVS